MRSSLPLVLLLVGLVPACAASSAPVDSKPAPSVASPAPSAVPPAASASAAAVDPNLCPMDKPDTWKACVGKMVEVRGQEPKMVYQHPMIAPMTLPGSGAPTVQQSYLEIAGGSQIIVLSKTGDKCTGAKRVKGSLREINLGGPSGTKESYSGWAIENATITCE